MGLQQTPARTPQGTPAPLQVTYPDTQHRKLPTKIGSFCFQWVSLAFCKKDRKDASTGLDERLGKPSARPSRYAYVYSSKTLQIVYEFFSFLGFVRLLYRDIRGYGTIKIPTRKVSRKESGESIDPPLIPVLSFLTNPKGRPRIRGDH